MDTDHLLEAILNSISEGVMTLDKDWKIVSWNRAAEQITGFHREDVLGRECTQIFRAALCRESCPVDRALTCGHPYQDVQVTVRNKRDEVVHLLINAAPLYDTDGTIIGGLETFRDVSQNHWMHQELQVHFGFKTIVGHSTAMRRVYEVLSDLIDTNTTVLVQGESGTGKELIAKALHFHGPRKDKSFVAINCSAIPEALLEAELFGHKKGAFTGAVSDRMGRIEMANGGTLFLDEIGEISPAMQVKLLRVLEEREFERIGDNRTIKVDVRLITATNKNLYKEVLRGTFRDDLYFRLAVFPVDLPPLRERVEDIRLLLGHFVDKFNKQMGKRIQGIAGGVLELLESYRWPGNIRELANAIEHAFVHCKGLLIHPEDLPPHISTAAGARSPGKSRPAQTALDSVERELIIKELEASNWKKNIAARRLRMSRSTLWRKMQKYAIDT